MSLIYLLESLIQNCLAVGSSIESQTQLAEPPSSSFMYLLAGLGGFLPCEPLCLSWELPRTWQPAYMSARYLRKSVFPCPHSRSHPLPPPPRRNCRLFLWRMTMVYLCQILFLNRQSLNLACIFGRTSRRVCMPGGYTWSSRIIFGKEVIFMKFMGAVLSRVVVVEIASFPLNFSKQFEY